MPFTFEDDDSTLAAVLALIDEWEVEMKLPQASEPTIIDGMLCSPSIPSSPPSPTVNALPTTSHREWATNATTPTGPHNRRDEIVFLRRTVRALEAQLTELRVTDKGGSCVDAAWVWQQIASRQRQHRHESERENQRLRVQIQEQRKIAKNVLRMLVRAGRHGEETQAYPTSMQACTTSPVIGLSW